MLVKNGVSDIRIYSLALTVAFLLLVQCYTSIAAENDEYQYFIQATFDENFSVERLVQTTEAENQGANFKQIRWTNTDHSIVVNIIQQPSYFKEKEDFNKLESGRFHELKEINTIEGKMFLLITDPNSSDRPGDSVKDGKQELQLTGFSLEGDDYRFMFDSSSAFSWESEGWQSSDFSSFFSDDSKFKTGLALFTEEDGEIYIKFVSNEPAFQPESDRDE